jgi:hypothetical protein
MFWNFVTIDGVIKNPLDISRLKSYELRNSSPIIDKYPFHFKVQSSYSAIKKNVMLGVIYKHQLSSELNKKAMAIIYRNKQQLQRSD